MVQNSIFRPSLDPTQDKLRAREEEKAALQAQRDETHKRHGDQQRAMQLLSDQTTRMSHSLAALEKDLRLKDKDLTDLAEELEASYREVAQKDANAAAAELAAQQVRAGQHQPGRSEKGFGQGWFWGGAGERAKASGVVETRCLRSSFLRSLGFKVQGCRVAGFGFQGSGLQGNKRV